MTHRFEITPSGNLINGDGSYIAMGSNEKYYLANRLKKYSHVIVSTEKMDRDFSLRRGGNDNWFFGGIFTFSRKSFYLCNSWIRKLFTFDCKKLYIKFEK